MIDNLVLNFTLQKQWKELTKDEPYSYYVLYFIRELDNDKISTMAFKFPSYEDLCCSDPYIEEQKIIEGNVVHIVDMRTFAYKDSYLPNSIFRIYNPAYPEINPSESTKTEIADLFTKFYNFEKMQNIDIYSTLTKTERAAARAIYAEIGIEGDISVSKMIQNTGISRPVYNSLLNTLANTHCAEIDAHGVKGTHIKIISPTLLEHLSQN